jgi:hypothetical protein
MKGILLSDKVLVYERHTAVQQSIGLWKACYCLTMEGMLLSDKALGYERHTVVWQNIGL